MMEDLKFELLEMKKKSANLYAENQLLKVKIRKLENENLKKNKQIESLIDPKKCENIRKIVSEHSTLMLLQLEEQCKNLQSDIIAKDSKIRKLEAEINKLKIYNVDQSKMPQSKNNKMRNKRCFSVNENYNSFLILPNSYNDSINLPTITLDCSQSEKTEEDKLYENIEKIRKMKQFLQENDVSFQESNIENNINNDCKNNLCKIKTIHYDDSEKNVQVDNIKIDIKNIQLQIKNVIDELIIMRKVVQKMNVEQEKTKEIFQEKWLQFNNILEKFKELQVQDYLNLIDTRMTSVKKSASYSKKKKPRHWLTIKKSEINPNKISGSQVQCLDNNYAVNLNLKQENIKDSDDEDVQTGD